MTNNYYIGLDVHKDTIAIAYATGGSRENGTYHGSCKGPLIKIKDALRKLAKKIKAAFMDLQLCYEVGPAGFVLARHSMGLGLDVTVMARQNDPQSPTNALGSKSSKRAVHLSCQNAECKF